MPAPKARPPASDQNILNALILHQHQRAVEDAQKQLKESQTQMQAVQQEHEALKKKKELDDKLHKEVRSELDKMKTQFDGNYAFEKKTVKKETMQRARLAKTTAKKTVVQKQKEARTNAKKSSGTSSQGTRKTT